MCILRRMKRWIQEKQQRERHAMTVRRQRHKSLGEVETVSKSKRQQLLFHHFSTCPPQVGLHIYLCFFFMFYKLNAQLYYRFIYRVKFQILRLAVKRTSLRLVIVVVQATIRKMFYRKQPLNGIYLEIMKKLNRRVSLN